jgi:hypothetical protein
VTRGPQRNGGARHHGIKSRVGKKAVSDERTPVCRVDYDGLEPRILAVLADGPRQKRAIASALGVVEASLSELMTRMRRRQQIKLVGLTSGVRLWARLDYELPRRPLLGRKAPTPPVHVTKASRLRLPHERPASQIVSKQQSWWCDANREDWQQAVEAHEMRMRIARCQHFVNPGTREHWL